ncbi:MAG: ferritin family protein [Fidelibacterota bacterium]
MTNINITNFSSAEEILQYAISEEQDAYNFYMKVSKQISDPDLKRFLVDLARFEQEHYEILKRKLDECRANEFCLGGIQSSFEPQE